MMSRAAPALDRPSALSATAGAAASPNRAIVSEVIARWAGGAPADARAFLDCHPGLADDRTAVLDLAYEEYCLRREAGERPDPEDFCARFPAYRSSLRRLLEAHRLVEGSGALPGVAPANLRLESGDAFLGFVLVRELGKGGFARVFLARQPALGNRRVAVKISFQGAAEGETLGRLDHAHVMPVYSVDEDPATGLTAVCMPFRGEATLCHVIDQAFAGKNPPSRARVILEAARGALPRGESIDETRPPAPLLKTGTYVDGIVYLGVRLAEALAYTHAQGIYHRDLKPSNVLVTPAGVPLLLDFNLSFDERLADPCLGGTMPYMAPEHLRATDPAGGGAPSQVDARSDVYSLGVILYECLTNEHPFGRPPAELPPDAVRAHLLDRQRQGPVSLRETNPRVDAVLARVIEKCLAFDPAGRPQSAADLAMRLRRCLSPWRRGWRWVVRHPRLSGSAAALALAVGLSAAVASALRDPPHVTAARAGVAAYTRQDYAAAEVYFERAVAAAPANPGVWFARGRARQGQAVVQLLLGKSAAPLLRGATDDFLRADALTRDGRVAACLGFCYSLQNNHRAATREYQRALQAGFESPELLNDLGYGLHQLRQTPQALDALGRAIALGPDLAVAYHNRAWIGFLQGLTKAGRGSGGPPLQDIITDMERAVRLGPPDPEVFADAARVCARAAREDGNLAGRAVAYYHRAVELGQDPGKLKNELTTFSACKATPKGNPQFLALPERPSSLIARRTLRVIDPVPGLFPDALLGR